MTARYGNNETMQGQTFQTKNKKDVLGGRIGILMSAINQVVIAVGSKKGNRRRNCRGHW
jgi:hypothetical protein